MNQSVIELLVPSTGKAAPADVGAKAAPDASGELFRSTLAARLVPAVAGGKALSAATDAAPVAKALEAKIMKMIAGGASQAEIVQTLAAQLAESVGQKLETSGSDVSERLQKLFAKALAPPGADDGAGTSGAARARALAARYLKVSATAGAIVTQNGQPKRITGNLLDAHRAKDIPARTKHIALAPLASSSDFAGGPGAGSVFPGASAAVVQAIPAPSFRTPGAPLAMPVSSVAPQTASAAAPARPVKDPAAAAATPGALGTDPAALALASAAVATATFAAARTVPASIPALPATASNPVSDTGRQAAAVLLPHAAIPAPHAPIPAATADPFGDGMARFAVPSPAPAAASGDGRRVTLGSTAAVASGGDNLLGRILTRAVLAADVRAPQGPAASGRLPQETTSLAAAAPASPTTPASLASVVPPVVAQDASSKSDAALTAFINSFEAALKGSASSPIKGAAAPPAPAAFAPAPLVHLAADAQALAAAGAAGTAAPSPSAGADRSAPALPAPTMPPIDHSAIADQVLRGAFMRNVGTSSEIRLTLVPETLGNVTVKLVVDGGSVTAHVLAQTPEVRDALVSAQPLLTKSLADAGLKLTSFNVDLSGSGFAGFAQQQNSRQHDGQPDRRAADSTAWDDVAGDAPLEAVPSFGPSLVARPNAGDYNYLA
jgi:hypothetical protein